MRIAPILVVLALTTGCASPSPAPPTDPADPPPTSVDAPVTAGSTTSSPGVIAHCWETEEEITLTAGGEQPGARRVLRMRYVEEEGKVLSDTLRFDPGAASAPRLFTVTWAVDGETFALTDADGRMSGSGTLVGEPWGWTGWNATSRLDSGIRIEERATIGADGVLTLGRDVFGPDGQKVMTFHEEGRRLTAEECAERFIDARPHTPPAPPE